MGKGICCWLWITAWQQGLEKVKGMIRVHYMSNKTQHWWAQIQIQSLHNGVLLVARKRLIWNLFLLFLLQTVVVPSGPQQSMKPVWFRYVLHYIWQFGLGSWSSLPFNVSKWSWGTWVTEYLGVERKEGKSTHQIIRNNPGQFLYDCFFQSCKLCCPVHCSLHPTVRKQCKWQQTPQWFFENQM